MQGVEFHFIFDILSILLNSYRIPPPSTTPPLSVCTVHFSVHQGVIGFMAVDSQTDGDTNMP